MLHNEQERSVGFALEANGGLRRLQDTRPMCHRMQDIQKEKKQDGNWLGDLLEHLGVR